MTNALTSIQPKEKSLPEQAADQISQLIKDRSLQVGDKMPNEFELMEALNVGRGTIREAVKLLVARNILEIKRGKGTFICANPGVVDDPLGFSFYPDQDALAQDMMDVRIQLEPWVARLAAQRATDEQIALMEELNEKCSAQIRAGEDHLETDKEFHKAIAQGTQNAVVPQLIPIITYAVSLFGTFTKNRLNQATIIDHQNILDAIKARDGYRAETAMREHLERNRLELEKERLAKNRRRKKRKHPPNQHKRKLQVKIDSMVLTFFYADPESWI